jgi:uncharacterized membrane protein
VAEKHEGSDNRAFEKKLMAGIEKSRLFQHVPHPHKPQNVNVVHAQQRAQHANAYTLFNEKAAVWTTWLFSTMEIFWIINLFMAAWMIGNSMGIWHFDPVPFPLLLFIINIPQLPLLPLLAIGQAVLSRKQELQADEAFATTQKSFADIEQIMAHLSSQDDELIKQTQLLVTLLQVSEGGKKG